MSKFNRQLSIVGGLVILLGGVLLFQFFSQQKAPPAKKPQVKKVLREVESFKVLNQDVVANLDIQGRLVAFNKIDIFSEVSGKLIETGNPFKVGSYFKKGSILLRIDDKEAKLSLLAQKANFMNAVTQMMPDLKIDYPQSFSNWKLYLDNFDVDKPLASFPEAVNDQEKYFVSSKNLLNQFYTIKSQEERLSKYTVYAPFSGVLTQTAVNPGALVRASQKMGELMNTGYYELEATVRLADVQFLKAGSAVQLFSTDTNGSWSGKVKRISNQIDPNTQTVIVYIGVSGNDLREGMYLKGKVASRTLKNVIEIPGNLIVNQNAVFAVTPDSTLKATPVNILTLDENKAIVSGLEDGTILIKNVFPGAHNGQKIRMLSGGVATN